MDSDVFAAVRADGTGVDFAVHNTGVTPEFLITEVVDMAASEKAGHEVRVPIETVLIRISGDTLTGASHPVDAAIKARFPEAYRSWKASQEGYIDGTPLKDWPLMSPARIRELEAVHIHSVEALASMAETNLPNVTEGRAMRDKAREFLSKDTVQYRELEELRGQVAGLAAMMERIEHKLNPLKGDPGPKIKKKPGRKPGWNKPKIVELVAGGVES
jgi:hypothetical protein